MPPIGTSRRHLLRINFVAFGLKRRGAVYEYKATSRMALAAERFRMPTGHAQATGAGLDRAAAIYRASGLVL